MIVIVIVIVIVIGCSREAKLGQHRDDAFKQFNAALMSQRIDDLQHRKRVQRSGAFGCGPASDREDPSPVGWRDADSLVCDRQPGEPVVRHEANMDVATGRGKFQR